MGHVILWSTVALYVLLTVHVERRRRAVERRWDQAEQLVVQAGQLFPAAKLENELTQARRRSARKAELN